MIPQPLPSPASASAAPPHRRRARLVGAALAALLPASAVLAPQPAAAAPWRPFASSSPYNVPIGARPEVDPGSAAMVARAAREDQAYAGLYEFGIPIYTADASTPRVDVTCTMEGAWGDCPLSGQKMPVPAGAVPQLGSDGAMVVIDSTDHTIGEYWQAERTGSGWRASFGAVNSLKGSGWGGSSTGSGASRLGGVVRVSEIAAGDIDHALVVQSDNVCARVYRAPAIKTDGTSYRTDCLTEGARLQLDPSIDLDGVVGLTRGERTVAEALQTYGAYVIDQGGAPLSVSFQRAADATATSPGAVYTSAGFAWDYYGMPHVPWDRLRVLA
ncbi:hypothetical protein GCM10022197_42200 [Microlunatus spumicola]|uniref:Uncharacterized protein n=1 Tax=Microlunatus spumicola TaxID=81499 RepID=A0ABP6YFZ9_9ACTN